MRLVRDSHAPRPRFRSDAVRALARPGSDPPGFREACRMGSVVKKRRKRMAKKKHRKLLRKTRVQRRRLGK
ncbi:hypothetical protein Ade02nite_94150 [Paractinoplanes deccanensis]|uniref:Ribosomal protein mS38 C-terminal domain-containing protein n=1 Tax=Paractinoplanes deccanensis TaxID=113561 RepID=A0ABQ3YL94_9ACTN|nr:hypothetical protein Ade02nite_94150 [Actinoplanes deccanensis]